MSKWETMKLGSLTKIQTGKLDANASSDDGRYPFFTCAKDPLKISNYAYDCECVLVAGNGDLNVKYYSGKFNAYQRTYIIESIDKNRLFVPYLFLYLCGYIETLRKESIGGVIKYIKLGNLTEASIPLPPIEAQRQIAETSGKISQLMRLRKAQLAELEKLVKSQFVEMFGDPIDNPKKWDIVQLDTLFDVGSSKRIYQREQTESGIPFLRISDLVQRITTGMESCELYISEDQFADFSAQRLVPEPGDILVTSRGTLGLCYIVKDNDQFYFQDGMISWLHKKSPEVNTRYISYLFQLTGFRKQIDEVPTGSTVNYLSLSRLAKLNVMYPPMEMQARFVTFVEAADKSKLAIQQALDETQRLFDSLMAEYFEA